VYGRLKLEGEEAIRTSRLPWVILRLGGVFTVDPTEENFDHDVLFFGTMLPTDGRVHSVDVRDVATALAAATTADVVGETLLIAGDDSHLLTQIDTFDAPTAAKGLSGLARAMGLRQGNPESDDDWFLNCWMDVSRAEKLLSFQHHSWPDMIAEIRAIAGWRRRSTQLAAPLARTVSTPTRGRPCARDMASRGRISHDPEVARPYSAPPDKHVKFL
jgi:nucleoside-diphosphate-sugar epimerase